VPLSLSSITWCSEAGKVTAGLAESNGSLPPGGWLIVSCGLTACIPGSAPGPTLGNEYGKPLPVLPFYDELSVLLAKYTRKHGINRRLMSDRPRYCVTTPVRSGYWPLTLTCDLDF